MAIKRPIIALQLYTLRDLTSKDMAGTLREVAGMGYEAVEFAGYGNVSVQEARQEVDQLGLGVISSHVGLESLQNNLPGAIADAQVLGNQFVVCPFVGNEYRSAQGYRELAQILNEAGGKLRDAGLQLCYHNHDFEFQQFDGQYGLDLLYGNSDPALLQAEIDTYWVQKGGANPTAYIRQYSDRVPLVHLKDMAGDEKGFFAEVGEGIMDWPSIFAACEAGSTVAYIVEQDVCPGNPLDSVRTSIENLKKMGKLG